MKINPVFSGTEVVHNHTVPANFPFGKKAQEHFRADQFADSEKTLISGDLKRKPKVQIISLTISPHEGPVIDDDLYPVLHPDLSDNANY